VGVAQPHREEFKRRFNEGEILDILLAIMFSGQPPAWPM
jgi:hypothetical protein